MNNTPIAFHHPVALEQLKRADALAKTLGGTIMVNGEHCSKSITLPVPTILLPGLRLTFRDNFHDLNLLVESDNEISLPLSFFYSLMTFESYMEDIAKKRNYSYRDWSDEEMNDPRILRVRRKNGNGWSEVSGNEKDRWLNRMNDAAWHGRDWGSNLIAAGPVPFSAETSFYTVHTAYGEGMPISPEPYTGPCTSS